MVSTKRDFAKWLRATRAAALDDAEGHHHASGLVK
jgi:hypothetical protein